MLEALATRILGRFIDAYIKNFDPKQLQIALYNGEVNMTNLEVKKEALDALHLPINVVEGHISKLTATIPYNNLRGSPTKIDIEDVFLLVAPKKAEEYNEEEEKKRAYTLKMQKLDRAEDLKEQSTEGRSQEEQQKHQSFMSGVISLVVDNLQISVKNIHVRYEDSTSVPGHPFSIGLKLPLLSAVSTDENWTPTFIKAAEKVSRKLVKLTSMAIYWNTDSELFGKGMSPREGSEPKRPEHVELLVKFRDGLEQDEGFQYVLRPISGRAGVTMDKTGKVEIPKTKARLIFNELAFVLDDDQYRDTLMLLDFFHYFTRHHEYSKLRPNKTAKEDPQAWIRFAGQAVLRKIHERNRTWTWEYIRQRRDERKQYIDLFKKKQKGEVLSAADQESLAAMEEKLSYEDLRFWRSLARTQLRKENVGVKKPESKQTWTQWVWGSKKTESTKADESPAVTEEERQEMYKMIDYDEKRALSDSFDLPREAIKLQVESTLETGSFTLVRDPHKRKTEILSLNFDDFDAKFLQRPDSVLLDLKLGGLRAYDGCTEGSLFPQIVQVKDALAPPHGTTEDLDEKLMKGTPKSTKDPLLHLIAEQNPLDESADSKVDFKLKEIEVIYNPQFVVEIYKFFKPPERHMDSIAALMETAGAAVEGIRKQTRAGLEYALEEHKTVNAHLDIQAPLIIIPESITKKSTLCLIVDAGHVALNSKLIDKETIKEIQAKQKSKYTEEDYRHLESLMYDKFLLELDSTQVLLGPGIEATKAQLKPGSESTNYHIMDRINLSFVLETSIVPKATDITKTRVSGHLPILHASMSDKKYKNLMRLINSTLPKFNDELETAQSVARRTENVSNDSTASTRPRSKSVQLLESRQEVIIDDDASVKDQIPSTPAINLHQRNLELKFTVDKLQGSMYREDPSGKKPDQLLVELVAEHFVFDFYLRPYDMVAEVVLKSLNVDDHIEEDPLPEFKKIISSEGFSSEENKDLFKVKFVKVQKESPEFITTYEGIATHLDVAVSTINLTVTRKTLLTLLDFVLDTFTNPDVGTPKEAEHSTKAIEAQDSDEPDKIRIKADLHRIALILNNDGIRLATLSLQKAEVGVSLSGAAMKVIARLGSLSLLDDVNQGASADDPLRQLITIQGDELADFRYQTYDAKEDPYPGYDTNITLRSGSIKVNFLEEPFRNIIDFLVKFGKMQAIFNAARQAAANQANRVQENASKMHFDIIVKTPIIVFPRVMVPGKQRDMLTAHLGEIYAKNRFAMVKGGKKMAQANKITAGIRNVRLTSNFHYEDDVSEELEMIDKVDLDFKVEYVEHEEGTPRPDLSVDGTVSPINIRVAQTQLKFLLELSKTVPAAFAVDSDEKEDEALEELPASKTEPAKKLTSTSSTQEDNVVTSEQKPELSTSPEVWTKLDVKFKAQTIGLELILAKEDQPVGNIKDGSLSKFSINNTDLKLRMVTDGSLESELLIQSFTITDSRKNEGNKFRKVMSLINDNVKQQFMVSVSMSGGEERNLIAIVTIDSPRIIFAMDYIFALQAFASTAFTTEQPLEVEGASDEGSVLLDEPDTPTSPLSPQGKPSSITKTKEAQSSSMSISYTVTVEDAQVMLIANPAIANSEAIVLGTQRVLLASQNSMVLSVTKVGMFLCRMDKFETSRLRVLDDFSMNFSMNSRSQGKNSTLTTITLDIEPLVLRLSLRDILLAIQIFTKASEMTNTGESKLEDSEPQKIKDVKADNAPAKRSAHTGKSSRRKSKSASKIVTAPKPKPRSTVVMKREEMIATIDGIRVVLISDLHELPLLDWSVKKFNVDVRDWSGAITGDTSFDTYMNVFNFSKSAWEPLIEPWQLGFHLSREQQPECLSVELYSHKTMELTLTSATIALAMKSAQFFSTDEDVLSKPRGADAPFRIRNYTGFPLSVWAANSEDSGSAAKLTDGEEIPWRFEDPTTMREQLSPDSSSGIVGVRLEGSGFEALPRIPISREGETLYSLKPRQDKILHRLLVDVKLEADNVKYITFRSPLLVENKTQITIELGVYDPKTGDLFKVERVPPGLSRPAPVGAAYQKALILRPEGVQFEWSQKQHLFWRDLLKLPTRTVSCRDQTNDRAPPFYFQISASFDKSHPITGSYPYMNIRVFAPIEIQNLLPYDLNYRVHDKTTGKNYNSFLRKGGVYPLYTVELSHVILLQITMQDTPFQPSQWSVVNSSPRDRADFPRDYVLPIKDTRGIQLNLKLQYFNTPDSGGAFRVAVYSPYVVLDKTGLGLSFQSKASFSAAKVAAGQGLGAESDGDSPKVLPYMFSHPSDNKKNRALLKVEGSSWSEPQSFDAVGAPYNVVLPSTTQNSEVHVGVSVTAGQGEYKLTKVVTVTPRFILKNKIAEAINVREPGSSKITTMEHGDLLPLQSLRRHQDKQLCLCFPGISNQWSNPFKIDNVGTVHVKVAKAGQRQQLIKVDIILEGATIFLHLNFEKEHWPYKMRNESDTEFMFYQSNPHIQEDEEDRGSGWKPVRYKLPPRSIMQYAWDFPAAKFRELVITSNGKERHIKLAEIGNLIPMRLPQKIIDLNIVAEGTTQILLLSNYKPGKSIYKQKSATGSQNSVATGFEVKEQDSDATIKAQLRFEGIGLSLVNRHLKELLYLTLRNIDFKYTESKLYQTIAATIKWVQIDNQLYGGIFPIILYPSVVPKTGKEMDAHPILHAAVTRVKDNSYGVIYIKYATLLLQQLTIEIDEDFIYAMIDFTRFPGAQVEQDSHLGDENLDIPEPQQQEQGQEVYFELLHLQPMQLDVSFVRTERVNAEDAVHSSNPLAFFLNVMTMSIGNVNDAPLKFNALMLENARVSMNMLVSRVTDHYWQESKRQFHVIVGSADFLGNPVGLFNNITSGVADIFYEPYQGIVNDRPQDMGIGLAKGASSFVKKSVFGLSDSMAKWTGSMSKGLAVATMDKEYQDRRRMSKARNRPKHALYGITSGGNAFATSMASGIGGLARFPIAGAEKDGFQGFVKGLGKGVLGLATKPAIGAFDLASNVAEGVRNTTTVFDQEGLDRVRLTRFIGIDGVVRPFQQREALGQFWLKTLEDGNYFNDDYIAHLELSGGDGRIVMLTYNRILTFKTKNLTKEFDYELSMLQTITKERTGMNVILKDGVQGCFLPVQDEAARNWLYKQIAIAVNAFNEKHSAR
ncbi:MAG: hypothetical protein MMC33_008957 [Icmadophila ericetorum]|nr:hypothetical protein [Icmadophila ericetorum]